MAQVIPKMPVSVRHQRSNANLYQLLVNWLTIHQLGEAHHPPLQVRLTLPDGRQVSREPDIVVVLNDRRAQFTEQYFDGAPNIVVEIISPSQGLTTGRSSSSTSPQVCQSIGLSTPNASTPSSGSWTTRGRTASPTQAARASTTAANFLASGCASNGFGDSSRSLMCCVSGASCRRVSNRCQPPMGSNQSSIDSRRMALDSH
jgi:hypothetical protein